MTREQLDRLEHLRLIGRHYQEQIDALVVEAGAILGSEQDATDLICNGETLESVLRIEEPRFLDHS
jgi:hypothetical protein